MKITDATPPPVPATAAIPLGRWPPWRALLAMACLVVAARLALHFELPLPGCPLRESTGVPCPFCGSTRACAALASFDFTGALGWNPLMSFSLMMGLGWLGFAAVQPKLARLDLVGVLRFNPLVRLAAIAAATVWLLTLWREDGWGKRIKASWSKGTAWKWLLAAALALNWLYLWFHLPH